MINKEEILDKILKLSNKYLKQNFKIQDIENSTFKLEDIIKTIKKENEIKLQTIIFDADEDGWSAVNQLNRYDKYYTEILELYEFYLKN